MRKAWRGHRLSMFFTLAAILSLISFLIFFSVVLLY